MFLVISILRKVKKDLNDVTNSKNVYDYIFVISLCLFYIRTELYKFHKFISKFSDFYMF